MPPSRLKRHGIGRSRIDLLVRKPYGDGLLQREAIELKVWHPGRPDPLPQGIEQLDGYLKRLDLDAGTLVIFGRRPSAPPAAGRTSITHTTSPAGRAISLMRA